MPECPAAFDTPPEMLADILHERGWTVQDLVMWQEAVLQAFLAAGGWDMLPEGEVIEQHEMMTDVD